MSSIFGNGFINDMFILEAEGELDTRTSRLNAAINDFKAMKRKGTLTNDDIPIVLRRYGLKEENLTDAECARIMDEVLG